MSGWCFFKDGSRIAAVRARLGKAIFHSRDYKLRSDVARLSGLDVAPLGFEVGILCSDISAFGWLEVQDAFGDWWRAKAFHVLSGRSGLCAVADELMTLEGHPDEVLIRGYCFHTTERIDVLELSIGNHEYICESGAVRNDVYQSFPQFGTSRSSGFRCRVARHDLQRTGRLRAHLATGTTAETILNFPGPSNPGIGRTRPKIFNNLQTWRTPTNRVSHRRNNPSLNDLTSFLVNGRSNTYRQSKITPTLSIVTPLWNTKADWLAKTALSVLQQTDSCWEWVLVDDGSTDTSFLPVVRLLQQHVAGIKFRTTSHGGISQASNEALRVASAEYVAFLDHDDTLASDAIEKSLAKLRLGYDAVYSDEDKFDASGEFSEPFLKPDWSLEYFRSIMYVGHFLAVHREGALAIGGFDSRFDGVQDFEFMLRYSERNKRIGHVDHILYHWRKSPGSIAESPDAKPHISVLQRLAVQDHLDRLDIPARAVSSSGTHRVRLQPLPERDPPRVSVVIPTKDAPGYLRACLSSIFARTTYPHFEVVCVDNNTTNSEALHLMSSFPVKKVDYRGAFNFSAAVNLGAKHTAGEFLLFLNNDVEVVTPDWIEQMLLYARQPDVGAVGALLLYPSLLVQHAGVATGLRGTADHILAGTPSESDGYVGSLTSSHEVSAVTAACLMIRKGLFEERRGFLDAYSLIYQDVDLCLELGQAGYRNVFTPHAVLIHHESASRGRTYDFLDRALFLDRWEDTIAEGDPFCRSCIQPALSVGPSQFQAGSR